MQRFALTEFEGKREREKVVLSKPLSTFYAKGSINDVGLWRISEAKLTLVKRTSRRFFEKNALVVLQVGVRWSVLDHSRLGLTSMEQLLRKILQNSQKTPEMESYT